MAAISSIFLGIAAAGVAVQTVGTMKQHDARKDVTKASLQAEDLREEQMKLENMRKQRELIRQRQIARSTALARSVSQGAGAGKDASSSLFGAYGQIEGAYGRASNTEEQNLDIGAGLFDANRDIAKAQGEVATWEGISKFGQGITSSAMNIAQIGSTLWGPGASTASSNPHIGPWTTRTTANIEGFY